MFTSLFVFAACSEPQPLATNAAGIEWAAIVELAEPEVLARASGIFAWPEGQALPVFTEEDREVLIVGWSSAQLERFAPAGEEAAIAGARLRAATGCEDRLPDPAWAARWTAADSFAELEPAAAALPALTSTWLTSRCPTAVELTVDADCVDRRCDVAVAAGDACTVTLTLAECDLALNATLHAGGTICAGEPTAARPGCNVVPHVVPEVPPFEAETTDLFGGPVRFTPDFLAFNGLLIPDLLFEGVAYDLAVAGDQIVVAAGDGEPRHVCRGGAEHASRLLFYDADTLAPAHTATVPPCLTRLAAGDGELYAVFIENGAFTIGRLDERGRVTARAPADDRPAAGAVEPRLVRAGTHRVLDLELAGDRLVASFNDAFEDGKLGDGGNAVFTYDRATLAARTRFDYGRGQRWAMTAIGDGRIALANNETRAVEWLDVDTGTVGAAAPLLRLPGILDDDSLLELAYAPEEARVLVAGTRDPLVFGVDAYGAARTRGYALERTLDPVSIAVDPRDPRFAFVAGLVHEGPSYAAYAARMNVATGRFEPGMVRLGDGMPARMITGPGDAVFVLLTWSGRLVRLAGR